MFVVASCYGHLSRGGDDFKPLSANHLKAPYYSILFRLHFLVVIPASIRMYCLRHSTCYKTFTVSFIVSSINELTMRIYHLNWYRI